MTNRNTGDRNTGPASQEHQRGFRRHTRQRHGGGVTMKKAIVPVEATEEMHDAAFVDENGAAESNPYMPDAYKRMLSTRPPVSEEVVERCAREAWLAECDALGVEPQDDARGYKVRVGVYQAMTRAIIKELNNG